MAKFLPYIDFDLPLKIWRACWGVCFGWGVVGTGWRTVVRLACEVKRTGPKFLAAIGAVFAAARPAGLKIATRAVPLAEIGDVWNEEDSRRIVFTTA